MPPAIEAHGLVKYFGKHRVVDSVSLSVPEGAIYGVLGPNGAGKTTTLRMLLGIIEPDAGSRTLLGRDRPIDAAYQIGYLPEERGLYPAMTTREAVAFLGNAVDHAWSAQRPSRVSRRRITAAAAMASGSAPFPFRAAASDGSSGIASRRTSAV